MTTEAPKHEPFTAFQPSADYAFALGSYRRLQESPRYASEWGDGLPRAAHEPHLAHHEPQPVQHGSPLAKRTPKAVSTDPAAEKILLLATPAKSQPTSAPHTFGIADLVTPTQLPPRHNLHPMDVFWAMVNDITGKDKLAKFGQYLLRLLLHHAQQIQQYLSDDHVNIKTISHTHTSNDKILALVLKFARNPRAFARVLGILVCSVVSSRCAGLVPALAMFRQILRFGKSPFRVRALWLKVRENAYQNPKLRLWRLRGDLVTKSTLGDAVALYYSVNDEISLLLKLRFLRNSTLRAFATRHEAYAWYCDSWLAMYNAMGRLRKLSQQEIETHILIQVKQRSRVLSKQILGTLAFQTAVPDDDDRDAHALAEIRFNIDNVKLDILKTVSDIVFNSYTVFNVPLHFATVQIWSGISAAFLSSVKLYREKQRALERRQPT